jgi:hypothetical protein
MADKENILPRLTRAAAKRASAMEASDPQPPLKKKRVALSELPNLSNSLISRTAAVQSKLKKSRSEKKKQELELEKPSCKETEKAYVSPIDIADAENEVQDPHMVSVYVSDIYQYLRSMEVSSYFRFSR